MYLHLGVNFFGRKEITIKQALVDGEIGPTKTLGSQREIVMSQIVYDAFLEQKKRTYGKSDFVFCNSQGNPLDYRNVNRRVWKPCLEFLGLKHRRAYQTRHTAATLWLAAGENPEWIARQMGHSSTEMLFRVYSRYVPDITLNELYTAIRCCSAYIDDVRCENCGCYCPLEVPADIPYMRSKSFWFCEACVNFSGGQVLVGK